MNPATLAVVTPIVIAALGLIYLALFGQKSVVEWRRSRREADIAQPAVESAHGSDRPAENLPTPDFTNFIGRVDEQTRIHEVLRPYPHSQHPVVAIDGIGGSGKSALALAVARRYVAEYDSMPSEDRFGAVIWTSAKVELLTAEGPRPRPSRHRSLDDILDTIGIVLGREDVTRAGNEHKLEAARSALKKQRTLLIIDNLETIEDETIYSFLRELPAPTKAIVTTRHKIDAAVALTLDSLSDEDASVLLSQQFSEQAERLTPGEWKRILELSGRLPLAIVWSAAQIRLGVPAVEVLGTWERGRDQLAEFSFAGIWNTLQGHPAAATTMRAIAALPFPATSEILANCASTHLDETQAVLRQLSRLALVQRKQHGWTVHPLVRQYTLERTDEDARQLLERGADYVIAKLEGTIGDERLKAITVAEYEIIDADRPNIVFLVEWCYGQGELQRTKRIVAGLGYYLHARGLWSDAVRTWELGALAAEQCNDLVLQARFLTYLGYMALFMENVERAQFYHSQAVRLVDATAANYQHASLLRLQGYLARENGDRVAALDLFGRGLQEMRVCENAHGICRLLNDMAETLIQAGQLTETEAVAQEALVRADRSGELIERVRAIRLLSVHARSSGEVEKARAYATESRDDALASGWWEDAGLATIELAKCAAAHGSLREALSHAVDADAYFERIGSTRGRVEVADLITQFKRKGRSRFSHLRFPSPRLGPDIKEFRSLG
ncbi:NB-ARC domain-containing protein [Micromonospora echinofusca]|uniref:NB-ARC domain-containing protein n=1 Tax=Micromonospora echinofusca TaxID=47858 RepID=UPI0034390F98